MSNDPRDRELARLLHLREDATRLQIMGAVRKGLPVKALRSVASFLGEPVTKTAGHLRLPERTIARRKDVLKPDESDRLARCARLLVHAREVFGSPEKVRVWFSQPNRSLGGERPIELIDTDAGVQEVDDVLTRIEHGIF